MSDPASKTYKLLVVEDERNVGTTLVERLQREGFLVDWVKSVAEAESALKRGVYDLALLDIGLPDGDGFQVAAQVRESSKQTAVVFLTAYGNPEDRIRGLELGAEDYIVKPFHLKELLLRIQNSLKRVQSFAVPAMDALEVRAGKARIRFSRFEVEVDDGGVHILTHKELSILKLLYARKGEVVSREAILQEAWSDTEYPSTRTIDNFILRLRRLIEIDPENPTVIRSVRGVGYQLVLHEESGSPSS